MKHIDNFMYKTIRMIRAYENKTGKDITVLVFFSLSLAASVCIVLLINYLPYFFLFMLILSLISALYRLISFIIFIFKRDKEKVI